MFFALVPDAGVRAQLAPVAREWALQTHGRPTAPDSIHLTLAFVGAVPSQRVAALVAIGVAIPRAGFDLALDTVGDFPRAGVAWIAPSQSPRLLVALQTTIANALVDRAFPVDARPFQPHVTLARQCTSALATTTIAPIRWRVARLALVASTLDRAGARYRELAGWTLDTPAAT
ncbi:MAG: RNA 2',3'-cyclic phosphodiesterase [Betaproteobacteria bacterium]